MNRARWMLVVAAVFLGTAPVDAQDGAAQPAADAAPPVGDQPDFKPEELEQMLAPLALYPDSLLSQVLMASTYPVEVVQADRWAQANKSLQGDALAKELEKQDWDPAVRSLVNFPDVLSMMSENLSTTVKIGDAFIGQKEQVMQTIQRLRAKAKDEGNLKTTEQQNVTTTVEGGTEVIVIESSSPDVIYVPQYNPSVVYGSWPYPAYPPYPYYPPSYYPVATPLLSFGVGVAAGVAWGYAWGNANWGGNDIDIDIDRNSNRNTNINRDKFKNRQGQGGRGSFKHDPSHRQGAAYRNQKSANRAGAGTSNRQASQARSQYRGKAEAGRADISRGGADAARGGGANAARDRQAAANRSSAANRQTSSGSRGSALSDAGRGGQSARSASNRGNQSRASSPSRSSRPSGASRGGGGRGGGGRGGGRR